MFFSITHAHNSGNLASQLCSQWKPIRLWMIITDSSSTDSNMQMHPALSFRPATSMYVVVTCLYARGSDTASVVGIQEFSPGLHEVFRSEIQVYSHGELFRHDVLIILWWCSWQKWGQTPCTSDAYQHIIFVTHPQRLGFTQCAYWPKLCWDLSFAANVEPLLSC